MSEEKKLVPCPHYTTSQRKACEICRGKGFYYQGGTVKIVAGTTNKVTVTTQSNSIYLKPPKGIKDDGDQP